MCETRLDLGEIQNMVKLLKGYGVVPRRGTLLKSGNGNFI